MVPPPPVAIPPPVSYASLPVTNTAPRNLEGAEHTKHNMHAQPWWKRRVKLNHAYTAVAQEACVR